MLEAVRELDPQSQLTIEQFAPHIKTGFPWHHPEQDYRHLNTSERWWNHVRALFIRVYIRLGFSAAEAAQLATLAQARFLDLQTWMLFADTIPVLESLQKLGWRHVIVSNHVPELGEIVAHLRLDRYIDHLINSAEVGYEKPHPNIFRAALEKVGDVDDMWMIGDNIHADVIGAQNMGIKAILVREKDDRAAHQFDDLYGVREFLMSEG